MSKQAGAHTQTPETDAEAFMLDDGCGEAVMSEFARTLECQRDDLLAALEAILDAEESAGETDRPHMIQARQAIARAKGQPGA